MDKDKTETRGDAIALEAQSWSDLLADWSAEVESFRNKKTRRAISDDELYAYEHGLVGKREPNLPFKGSSDIRFRPGAEDIRKLKPSHISSICDAPHVVRMISSCGTQDKLVAFYDHIYRYWMRDFRERVIAAAHKHISRGRAFVKVTWEQEIESYSKIIEIDKQMREVIQGLPPRVEPPPPPQPGMPPQPPVVIPGTPPATDEQLMGWIAAQCDWDLTDEAYKKRARAVVRQIRKGKNAPDFVRAVVERVRVGPCITPIQDLNALTFDPNVPIQDGEWINEEILVTERELRCNSSDYGGKFKHVNDLVDAIHEATLNPESERSKTIKEIAQGINEGSGDIKGLIRLYERHCYVKQSLLHRINGTSAGEDDDDESYVKAIVTYCPDVDPDKIPPLRAIEYPYEFDGIFRWCYWQFRYNDTGEGPMCGEGAVEMGLPFAIEENTARNAAIDRTTLISSPRRFIRKNSGVVPGVHKPIGQDIEVTGDPTTVSHVEQLPALNTPLLQDAEGISQRRKELLGIGDVRTIGNYDRPPTKGQVDTFMAPYQGTQNFEMGNWLDGWSKVFLMVHLLCKQFLFLGKMDKVYRFDSLDDGTPVVLTPQDFQPSYMVFSGGDINRGDPTQAAQKMQAAIATTTGSPDFAPMVKPYYMLRRYLNDFLGPWAAAECMETPEKAEMYKQQMLQKKAELVAQMEFAEQQKANKKGSGKPGGGGVPNQLGGGSPITGPNMGAFAGAGA